MPGTGGGMAITFSQSLYDDLGDINLTDFGESPQSMFLGKHGDFLKKSLFTENKIYNLGNNNGGGMSTSSALAIAVSALAASSGGHPAETNNNSILSAVHQPMQVLQTEIIHSGNSNFALIICNFRK